MCFLSSAALAAAPEYMPTSVMVLELSGDATVTSKAVEMPLSQLVTRIEWLLDGSLNSPDPSHYQPHNVMTSQLYGRY